MRKLENAQRIVPLALDKALDPVPPILDSTHLLSSLNATTAHFFTGLISKRRGSAMRSK
jgi:hypothetical protein